MDPTTSHGVLYSGSGRPAESDNFRNGLESNGSRELTPSRPSSRLGFNRDILSPISSETSSESEPVQWSHSLVQNTITAVMDQAPTTGSVPQQSNNTTTPNDPRTPAPAYGHVSDNLSRSLAVSRPSPKNPRPSVSRLCFPFVTTSPRNKKKSTSPTPTPTLSPTSSPAPKRSPPRHKYSCHPSLLSPSSPGRPFPKHQRHNYRQHGYSRTALEQVKWFWSTRAEDQEGTNDQRLEGLPREGVSSIGQSIHPTAYRSVPTVPAAQTSLSAEAAPPPLPPMSVHPRRGDIKALRDPYAVHIDRAFVDVPTWTIGKALWMSELHVAVENLVTPSPRFSEEDISEGESDSEVDISATTSSDDSDATLVESESETDLPTFFASKPPTKLHRDLHIATTSDISSPSTVGIQLTLSDVSNNPKSVEIQDWLHSIVPCLYIPRTNPSFSRKRRKWTVNWYQRWELLVGLSRHDQDRMGTSSEVQAPPKVIRSSAYNTRRFLLADKSTEPEDDS